MIFGLMIVAASAYAGPEWQGWETHPQIEGIAFSSTLVGLVGSDYSDGRRFFSIDRRFSGPLREMDQPHFADLFPAFRIPRRRDDGRVLTASDGSRFDSKSAYCAEEDNTPHSLSEEGRPIKTFVGRCNSISAVEIVDDKLWLGTCYVGEGNALDGEGIVIQTRAGERLVKRFKEGLPGGIIKAIRRDPSTGDVWVATNEGLAVIDRDLRIKEARYFYEGFDPDTRLPAVLLSSKGKEADSLAYIGYLLRVKDAGYQETVSRIPADARRKMDLGGVYTGSYDSQNVKAHADTLTSFLPKELNGIVPFLIKGMKSPDKNVRNEAARFICLFNDDRAISYVSSRQDRRPLRHDDADSLMDGCIEKYRRVGLVPAISRMTPQQVAALPKGCLDRRSFPQHFLDSIDHIKQRPMGRSGLQILTDANLADCRGIGACFEISKGEFERFVGWAVQGFSEKALFGIAPCKTSADQ